jgi:hypothetical protein
MEEDGLCGEFTGRYLNMSFPTLGRKRDSDFRERRKGRDVTESLKYSNTGRCLELTKRSTTHQLEHYPVETAPPYYALLYVWGDGQQPNSISVNGSQLKITQTLHVTLEYLRDLNLTLSYVERYNMVDSGEFFMAHDIRQELFAEVQSRERDGP